MDPDAAMAPAAALPAIDDITLLFKCHKSTTVLSIPPTLPFPEIKLRLLAVLQSRGLNNLAKSPTPLPKNPHDFEFGVLVDRKDASKGWVAIEIKEQELIDTKGGKRKIGGRKGILNENPAGAGLVDGAWVAYRVRPGKQKGNAANTEPEDMLDIDMDIDEDQGWDVVLPSFEDD